MLPKILPEINALRPKLWRPAARPGAGGVSAVHRRSVYAESVAQHSPGLPDSCRAPAR